MKGIKELTFVELILQVTLIMLNALYCHLTLTTYFIGVEDSIQKT